MKLDLAMNEIKRWMDVYLDNSVVHEHEGQHEQSQLCIKIATQLNQVHALIESVIAFNNESESTVQFIQEQMKAEAVERLRMLEWPMLDVVIETLELPSRFDL